MEMVHLLMMLQVALVLFLVCRCFAPDFSRAGLVASNKYVALAIVPIIVSYAVEPPRKDSLRSGHNTYLCKVPNLHLLIHFLPLKREVNLSTRDKWLPSVFLYSERDSSVKFDTCSYNYACLLIFFLGPCCSKLYIYM